MKRRDFNHLLLHGSLASLLPSSLLSQFASLSNLNTLHAGKRVVLIQLMGGNDGLNTLVPIEDENYLRLRRTTALQPKDRIPINNNYALNSGLQPLLKSLEEGEILFINQIGHPYESRSHFESMDIWNTGQSPSTLNKTGWIGDVMDQMGKVNPLEALNFSATLSLSMKGKNFKGLAIKHLHEITQLSRLPLISTSFKEEETSEIIAQHLMEVKRQSDKLRRDLQQWPENIGYPKHPFSYSLQQTANAILSGFPTSFYLTQLGGFDTHVQQKKRHHKLLSTAAESLSHFISVLKAAGEWQNTTVVVISEFGRRVQENSSSGTDHGKGSVALVISPSLIKSGLYNALPNLGDLNDGDIPVKIDFRRLYSSLLHEWLKTPSTVRVFDDFPPLTLFK